MAERRAIQAGDAAMFLDAEGELNPRAGVWLAVEDEGADSDGVARVLLQRITDEANVRRVPVAWVWVTDTIEERVAWTLMGDLGE